MSLNTIQLSDNPDIWTYTWGKKYSSMKMYNTLTANPPIHDIFKPIWNSACQIKQKVFIWLLMHNRVYQKQVAME
jgi:hypothetical protein